MSDRKSDLSEQQGAAADKNDATWQGRQVRAFCKTPIGLFGIGITTMCFTLTIIGLFGHVTGLIENQYAAIVTFLVFPSGMIFGLILIPVASYMRRKKMVQGQFDLGYCDC